MRHVVLSLAALVAAAGCQGARNSCGANCNIGDGSANGPITVSPAVATLTVKGGPATQQFTATSITDGDITARATWSLGDATLGTVTAGKLTTNYPLTRGGVVSVLANYGNDVGAASVTITYVAPDVIDPSAPPDAPNAFGGPDDPNARPAPVYPFDGTMLARNIRQMNLQWTGNPAHRVYRIHVVGSTIDLSFYVGSSACRNNTQCSYKPKDADWSTIAHSASGQKVTVTISGSAGMGQPVGSSAPIALHFSPSDVEGGLYYFSTSIRGIKRLPFGASTATDFIANGNQTGCVGCHAVTRDGKKVSAVFGGGDGYAGMVDGSNGQKYLIPPDMSQSKYTWNFETFSPDGTQMITNWAGKLQLRDGTTGNLIKDIPQAMYGAKQAVMPEWSPDGQSIVFVGIPNEGYIGKDMSQGFFRLPAGDWILGNAGSIMVMPFNNGNFGQAQAIVPSVANKEYNFYPSWSPDSKWIVFATGVFPGSSPTAANNGVNTAGKLMSYDQDSARLRLVQASGGAVIELPNATHAMNRTATWPKFAPFVQDSGRLVFFTFSSKFAYGFVVPDKARPQLWMAAIDLTRAQSELGAGDPSYPPFWLPFQDPAQNNHEGIWTTEVSCTNQPGGDCPPEFTCENGMCVPKVG